MWRQINKLPRAMNYVPSVTERDRKSKMLITNTWQRIWFKNVWIINQLFNREDGRLLEICNYEFFVYSEKVQKSNKI